MIKNVICLLLFILLIVLLQIKSYFLLSIWALVSIFLFFKFNKFIKSFVITNILFGIGFFIYLQVINHWIAEIEQKELHILLHRLALACILIPLFVFSFFSKLPFITYWGKPQWKDQIYFPFIWTGFHKTTVRFVLLIALTSNIIAFMPLAIRNGWSFIQEVWLLAIIFSITNAVLEEVIWRGTLLSRFSEQLGEKWAVVVTSLGFGLQHYSLGFPWLVCIAFSIGGMFYGGMTIKSKSIIPSVIWHMTLNVLMVLSGLILKETR